MTELLIVDDNEQNLYMLQVLLKGYGYEVVSAANGVEALEKARSDPPDMIIADILMPVMDGFTLCREWKSDQNLKDIPFVFYTATYTDPEDEKLALNLGADGFIVKPVEPDRFIEMLRAVIEKHETGPSLAPREPVLEEEPIYFREYSQTLVRKLEHKMLQLQESEEKYRVLVESANEAIIVAQDGMFKFLNPRAMELLGYSEDELTSVTFAEFIHPDDREMVMERHLSRLKGEELPQIYPFRFIDKDGDVRWAEINTARIIWKERPATLNFLNDITEKKRIEEELQKIERLESIGILAGGIAHDLNNYLTAILGNMSLAMMYEEPLEKDKRLAEAEKACMLIKDLTHQLLTFSKGGAPVLQTANIAELLRNSATIPLSGSNVRCDFSIPDDLWAVEINSGQINQVINNLVINATQAMPGGGVIKIRAENTDINEESALPLEAGAYIKVSVEDEGIGISAEYISRIFDPFYTTKQEGSGLGLATSYSIVEKHNGHITVESQVEVGTTFHIYLPASPEETSIAKEADETKPIMGEGRVLVMDDEEIVGELATDMLSSLGYSVTIVIDGAEAVITYKEAMESGNPFDAVIADLTIPGGMGGKETIQRLVDIDPKVKAIVSSGYSDDPVLANFREYGFKGVVAKPYKTMELSEVLHRVIAGVD